ncbi:MAG: hypothetical protein K1000chlam2_01674 [Chlamydiae bacterium]|nr:hypothetical protein [Chlamydiota bacterium]
MNNSTPLFGFMSGISTTIGFLPHILFITVLLILKAPIFPSHLIIFAIGAKLLGEWLFLSFFRSRMDKIDSLSNWRSSITLDLFKHPNVILSSFMMLLDASLDVILIYMIIKVSIPLVWALLILLGCQALSSPIQGTLSDRFSRKSSLLFAMIANLIVLLAFSGISSTSANQGSGLIINLLGLSSFSTALQLLLLFGIKGLFGNITVICRASIAEIIRIKTLEKQQILQ